MRVKTKGVWFLCCTLFFATPALARAVSTGTSQHDDRFFFSPSFSYVSGARQRSASNKETGLYGKASAGLSFFNPFFLGFTYDYSDEKVESSGFSLSTDNRTLKYGRTSYGPMVGVVYPSFYFLITYFLSSEMSYTDGTSNFKYYSGNLSAGYDGTIGFKYPITEHFGLGGHISYQTFTYTVQNDGAQNLSLSPTLKESKIIPAISVWLTY